MASNTDEISRREFLALATRISATAVWAQALPFQIGPAWHERRDLYPEGVASGDPDHESVILWTRRPYADGRASARLHVEVARDARNSSTSWPPARRPCPRHPTGPAACCWADSRRPASTEVSGSPTAMATAVASAASRSPRQPTTIRGPGPLRVHLVPECEERRGAARLSPHDLRR